jgi:DnaJ-class molecular chaperone
MTETTICPGCDGSGGQPQPDGSVDLCPDCQGYGIVEQDVEDTPDEG